MSHVIEKNSIRTKNEIRMSDVSKCLMRCYNARRKTDGSPLPVMLWGPPGTAKSAIVKHFALNILKVPFIDIRLPLYDPIDLKGAPQIKAMDVAITNVDGKEEVKRMDVTTFVSPGFLPYNKCVICFEEIANAHESTMVTAQRITLDRSLDNGWNAHKDTMIICCSNRISDNCGANALLQALDNRLVHFEVIPDKNFWIDWVLQNYTENEHEKKAASLVISFLSYRPDFAYLFDPESALKDIHGWPSFRTWEMVIAMLTDAFRNEDKITNADVICSIMGSIGVAVGLDFQVFVELHESLPDIKALLEGEKFEIPKDQPDRLACLVGAIAGNCCEKYHDRIYDILVMLEKAKLSDWSILLFRLCNKFDDKFVNKTKITKNAIDFCMRHRAEAFTVLQNQ